MKHDLHEDGELLIPSYVFRDRSISVLEAAVEYLVKNERLSYHQIAVLLNRNDRTIWTVFSRVQKKRKGYRRGRQIST